MLRRSHRKSKGGCVECKRRHIKCDEHRPKCRLCIVSSLECHFATPRPTPERDSSSSISQQSLSTCWKLSTSNDTTPPTPSPLCSEPSPPPPLPSDIDTDINPTHMHLLTHALLNKPLFNFAIGFETFHRANLALGFETALQTPFLLYQVLAFSACHLAHLNPLPRKKEFERQAMVLQTRAVSLFNSSTGKMEVDAANCVPILLFSSMLGQHLLADTLAKRDFAGLEGFIEHYVQCVEMHRGIYTIATSAWPLLMQSELEPVLAMSRRFTSREPEGTECALVGGLVETAGELDGEEKAACWIALRYLQVGFDAVGRSDDDDDRQVNRHQMICEWTMLVPPTFTKLLAARQPVALVILAHYALLLHHGRELWQVRDAGFYVFKMIATYLGPEWDVWLEYPQSKITQYS